MNKIAEIQVCTKSGAGMIVVTKSGLTGRTFNSDELHEGKQLVYLQIGNKIGQHHAMGILCDPKTLTLKGFID